MNLRVISNNLELNSESNKYIENKFKRLKRHLPPISEAKLEVSRTSARSQTERITAQMTLSVDGYTLRGQETGANLFAAVNAVADIMDRQIQRFKGRVYRSEQARKLGRVATTDAGDSTRPTDTDNELEDNLSGEPGKVVRTKRFPMKPMTVEDAIMQMEFLSHQFFLFYNTDNNQYNVAYRRHDGDYGIIEPELA